MKYIENIKNRVEAAQKRSGVVYAKTSGKLYKTLRLIYILAMSLAIIMSLLYVLSRYYGLAESKLAFSAVQHITTRIIAVGVCTGVAIVAIVLLIWKLEYISAFLTVVSGLVSCAFLYADSKNTGEFNVGVNKDFYFRHVIPFVVAAVFICWMVIVKLRAHLIFRRAYLNMLNRIYNDYHTEEISEDDWNNFLEDYDPRFEEEKRRRKKKGIQEYKPIVEEKEKSEK